MGIRIQYAPERVADPAAVLSLQAQRLTEARDARMQQARQFSQDLQFRERRAEDNQAFQLETMDRASALRQQESDIAFERGNAEFDRRQQAEQSYYEQRYNFRQKQELDKINRDIAEVQSGIGRQYTPDEAQQIVRQLDARRLGITPLPVPTESPFPPDQQPGMTWNEYGINYTRDHNGNVKELGHEPWHISQKDYLDQFHKMRSAMTVKGAGDDLQDQVPTDAEVRLAILQSQVDTMHMYGAPDEVIARTQGLIDAIRQPAEGPQRPRETSQEMPAFEVGQTVAAPDGRALGVVEASKGGGGVVVDRKTGQVQALPGPDGSVQAPSEEVVVLFSPAIGGHVALAEIRAEARAKGKSVSEVARDLGIDPDLLPKDGKAKAVSPRRSDPNASAMGALGL